MYKTVEQLSQPQHYPAQTRPNGTLEPVEEPLKQVTTHSIYGFLRTRVQQSPDSPALLAPGRRPASNAELLAQVDEAIGVLRTAGLDSRDCVGLVLPNGPELVAGFLSVAAATVCAPLNPAYQASEFDFYLKDLNARALILEKGYPSPARSVAAAHGIPVIELTIRGSEHAGRFSFALSGSPDTAKIATSSPGRAALVLHTSGTTSRPKMVELTEENLCISALNIARSLALTPSDRCLNIMPMFHIHGLVGAALSTMASGGSLICTSGMDPQSFFDWLDTLGPSWYTAVPTMHQAVLTRARQLALRPLRTSLRFIRSCSSALPSTVMAALEAQFDGTPVLQAYGMTEASHQISCNPLPPSERKAGSVGIPTGTSVAIMDANHNLLAPGEVGEVVVAGPALTSGYVNNPEANTDAFASGWFRTGDLGLIDEDGYLFLHGRIKELIVRGGSKVSPYEIEEVLLDHPAVAEAVAFALPHPSLGEEIGAAVVLRNGTEADERSLQDFASNRLANFKQPRRIAILREMPKGATGKVQRIGMAKRLGLYGPAKAVNGLGAPKTPGEQAIAEIWRSILSLDHVRIKDDFFDLGGDSLSAMILTLELERISGAKFELPDILAAPTIEQQAVLIDTVAARHDRPRIVAIQAGGSRPPFFCIGAGPRLRSLAQNLGVEQPFLAPQHPDFGELPFTLEDIATYHLSTIRSVQREGPYFLGGWCLDGVIAYEVAQQLTADGEEVGLVAIFDPPFLTHLGVSHIGLGWVGRKLLKEATYGWRRRLGLIGELETGFEGMRRQVSGRYRPVAYPGKVSLFQSEQRARHDKGGHQLEIWSDLIADGLSIYRTIGDHGALFRKPEVATTAQRLGVDLREAQRNKQG